jgi:hypothetical protein
LSGRNSDHSLWQCGGALHHSEEQQRTETCNLSRIARADANAKPDRRSAGHDTPAPRRFVNRRATDCQMSKRMNRAARFGIAFSKSILSPHNKARAVGIIAQMHQEALLLVTHDPSGLNRPSPFSPILI